MSLSKPKFWLWELMQSANGEKLRHFKTFNQGREQCKMYFTDSRVIFMHFSNGQHESTEYRTRRPHDSLLGFETMATEALTKTQREIQLTLSI